MKKFGKMIKGILRIWLFYLIVCLVIPPLYHKRADEENRECERVLNMDAKAGSTVVKLKASYLDTLENGKYIYGGI